MFKFGEVQIDWAHDPRRPPLRGLPGPGPAARTLDILWVCEVSKTGSDGRWTARPTWFSWEGCVKRVSALPP